MEPADGHPTIQHCIRSFEPYLAANRRTEKPVIHISLNPHPDDVLTDEQLTAIGQEYMEKMGYGNQPYIIYRHEDIGRPHIHIVSLRIDEQGKKIKKNGNARPLFAGSWRGNTICYPPRRWSDGNPCR